MIRVLVADDHPVVREGLKRLAADEPDIDVVAEARDGDELLDMVSDAAVDVVLLDISMPGPNFLELIRDTRTRAPQTHILVLSVHPEKQFATRALRAGAAGYLTKDHSPDIVLAAIRRVADGGRFVTPSLAEQLAAELHADARRPHRDLSDREYEVLRFLAGGMSVSAIAESLGLSSKTVSTYRARVLEKLGLGNNAELVRYAVEQGLVP